MTNIINNNDELRYWLALWRTAGVGPVMFAEILTRYQKIQHFYENLDAAIADYRFKAEIIAQLKQPDWAGVDADLCWAETPGHHILTCQTHEYPERLRQIAGIPPLLFVDGDASLLVRAQIGMVGSRNPTAAGRDIAYQFAKTFAASGLVVTSGLALGIDAACHEGALLAQGKTLAVLGTGIDVIYPKRHAALAKRINQHGAIVTEFPTGVQPIAQHFPRRNRIISGLSLGVLVIEAAYGSGSLITANYALEQNREVFAVPGSIHNPLARGCHALIKQGAKLVETAQDVLDEIGGNMQTLSPVKVSRNNNVSPKTQLPADQAALMRHIGFETTAIDQIIAGSGLTAEEVSSMLLLLELEGCITAAPGGYVRLS